MKLKYETPEMEVVTFETEDIITTSDGSLTPPSGEHDEIVIK